MIRETILVELPTDHKYNETTKRWEPIGLREYDVEVIIDIQHIAKRLAGKAIANKNRKAVFMSGDIEVTAKVR